jgi:hypothetical protein
VTSGQGCTTCGAAIVKRCARRRGSRRAWAGRLLLPAPWPVSGSVTIVLALPPRLQGGARHQCAGPKQPGEQGTAWPRGLARLGAPRSVHQGLGVQAIRAQRLSTCCHEHLQSPPPTPSTCPQDKLLGQTPEAAISAAASSIYFFRRQQDLASQAKEEFYKAKERKNENRMAKARRGRAGAGLLGGGGAIKGAATKCALTSCAPVAARSRPAAQGVLRGTAAEDPHCVQDGGCKVLECAPAACIAAHPCPAGLACRSTRAPWT